MRLAGILTGHRADGDRANDGQAVAKAPSTKIFAEHLQWYIRVYIANTAVEIIKPYQAFNAVCLLSGAKRTSPSKSALLANALISFLDHHSYKLSELSNWTSGVTFLLRGNSSAIMSEKSAPAWMLLALM
jgi:hypothetical protein